MEKNEWPKRKHPRLDYYDYSEAGAYFITMCTEKRRCILSRISVGRGLAPAAANAPGVRGLAPAAAEEIFVEYTEYGKIAEEQMLLLERRYPFLSVDQYVIMPNHIHVIFILDYERLEPRLNALIETGAAGASPRPTVMDIVCAYKSLTTRACKARGFKGKMFQTSFYDHVIRNRADYEEHVKYIYENPMQLYYKQNDEE